MSTLTTRSRELRPDALIAACRAIGPPAIGVVLAVILQLVVKPWLGHVEGGEFYAKVLLDIGTNVILAVSLTMVNGFTGQFSIGHAAFMAIGGYAAAGLVYYGSARIFANDDFNNAKIQGGILSTMLTDQEIEVATGKFVIGRTAIDTGMKLDASVKPLAHRAYAIRIDIPGASDHHVELPALIDTSAAQLSEGTLVTSSRDLPALPSGDAGSLADADAHLMLRPHTVSRGDVLFFVSCIVGGLAAAGCGYFVGLPSLRLRGDYLAIVTLGFGEIVRVLIEAKTATTIAIGDTITKEHLDLIPAWGSAGKQIDDSITVADINQVPWWTWPKLLGGSLGFSGLPSYASLFWIWLFAAATLIVAFRLKVSTYGRAFLSIREDEIAAEAMGINTTRYKVRAFVIAAFFAGIAGAVFAHTSGVQLKAGELGFQKSFDIIILVVLGGLGSISGATIAAIMLTILPELLREPPTILQLWGLVIVGAAVVLSLLFARKPGKSIAVILLICAVWEGLRYFAAQAGINLSDYRMVIYALILILMMILRPQGLMGVGEIWNLKLHKGAKA